MQTRYCIMLRFSCKNNLSFEFNSLLDHVQVGYLTLAIN